MALELEQHMESGLVRRAQQGDDAALSRLLAAARPRLYRWALVQTGSPDDAEDIVQETMLRASRHIRDYAFGARFTTWLYSVLRRTAADWRRTRSRRASILRDRYESARHTVQPEPRGGLLDIVRAGLHGLPARQREIFDLVDLQEYTPAEVASLLDMNPTTVRVHLLRARRTIRRRILEAPGIAEDMNE
ncbi:MAG TPA: RNA polymerase sigma factor [Longimicrobiales bacterium]